MSEAEFQRGIADAKADIARKACRLFFQNRGAWGDRFTELMRDRFNVQVVHVSDITWDAELSYHRGYNSTIQSHIDGEHGAGSYDLAWREVQAYRQESYRKWLASQKKT